MNKKKSKPAKPNRIFELMKARGWTYPDVAARVSAIAIARGDDKHAKVHPTTINRLALGKETLTHEWMELLAETYAVPAGEIISAPVAKNMRHVRVICALEANKWAATPTLSETQQTSIMIIDHQHLLDCALYAGEIKDEQSNLLYSPNSIVIFSKITDPAEIVEGRRYHVRIMREDGMIENTIKLLVRDPEGQLWLRPESTHPAHQDWMPLAGKPGFKIEIVGRKRAIYQLDGD